MEDEILDTSGLMCPIPILRLKKKMQLLENGAIIRLLTTDKSSAEDIAAFCDLTHNTLITSAVEQDVWIFTLKKGLL